MNIMQEVNRIGKDRLLRLGAGFFSGFIPL
jgi:hypothetical protein